MFDRPLVLSILNQISEALGNSTAELPICAL
jgi:hypothetical protein